MRVGYADPPYPGQAQRLYAENEVDHRELLAHLDGAYDGWLLHTSSPALPEILGYATDLGLIDYRVMAWVKPWAAFRKDVPVAYAWEPVLVKPCRKPVVDGRVVMRDFISERITMQRGFTGAKPEAVCFWAFSVLGMESTDHLVDLFPGSGAVSRAWDKWRGGPDRYTVNGVTVEQLALEGLLS